MVQDNDNPSHQQFKASITAAHHSQQQIHQEQQHSQSPLLRQRSLHVMAAVHLSADTGAA